MKKYVFSLVILAAMLLAFTACGGNGNVYEEPTPQPSTALPPTPEPTPTPEAPREWTIDELGATIAAAGNFWNEWWASHHTFEWGHIDDSRRNWNPWYEEIAPAHHPLSRGYAIVLPSSGFESVSDIGTYLLQFYTQAWVNRGLDEGRFAECNVTMEFMVGEYVYLFGWTGFEEYDGYLYIFVQPEWSARPDWATATHTLIEQEGNRAVIETVVSTYVHGYTPSGEMPTIIYRFTLIDGKIDSGFGQLHIAEPTQDFDTWQGLDVVHGSMILSIHRAEDVDLERFVLHSIDHTILWGQGYTATTC